jgi:hypothetical protein
MSLIIFQPVFFIDFIFYDRWLNYFFQLKAIKKFPKAIKSFQKLLKKVSKSYKKVSKLLKVPVLKKVSNTGNFF